jgi:3-methyladenine DNA glycosylase AlkD
MSKPVHYIADHLRQVLKNGGSAPYSIEMQRFFKEEIQSRGWYMKELRQLARRFTRVILGQEDIEYIVRVADDLFRGSMLEEKVLATLLLEPCVKELTDAQLARLDAWLDRVGNWAEHDALVHSLIGPMLVADPRRLPRVLAWAHSPNRWRRRAAAVSLLRGTRQGMFWNEVQQVTRALAGDEDEMVRKGLAWLLRETGRYDGERTLPLLMEIRERAPRPLLRTACERLSNEQRAKVLAR